LHHYGDVEMTRSGSMAMARMPANRLPYPMFRQEPSEEEKQPAPAVESK
jgi:hypothetical protein